MGQKVNPISMRLQLNKDWRRRWFANKRTTQHNLIKILRLENIFLDKFGSRASINKVDIEDHRT